MKENNFEYNTPPTKYASDYYSYHEYCGNCGEWFYIYIKKGTLRKDIDVKCIKCECRTS